MSDQSAVTDLALPLLGPAEPLSGLDSSLAGVAAALEASGQFQVLRKLGRLSKVLQSPPANRGSGVILDTESTGLSFTADHIIEIGLLRFDYCRDTGCVWRESGEYGSLEDPGVPIPPEAAKVNGITQEMVLGQKIDDDLVMRWLAEADIIIAHNASFDRAMMEAKYPEMPNFPWACSRAQVDWAGEGLATHKLDYIAYRLGFFYSAHRAVEDCRALLEVLSHPLPGSGKTPLKQLLEAQNREDLRLWALGSRINAKDQLRARGYKWFPGDETNPKAWWREITVEDYDLEVRWLLEEVYLGRPFRLGIDRVSRLNRFSTRQPAREVVEVPA